MQSTTTSLLSSLLEVEPLSRVRRNHGLEHATLHVLAASHPQTSMAGHSDPDGFWILGDISLEALQNGVEQALRRMRAGEANLAIHPFCGTNFVASGTLAGLAAASAMFGARRNSEWWERLPLAIGLATIALIVGQPLGLRLQERVTTSGKPGELEVVEITQHVRRGVNAFRIRTRG